MANQQARATLTLRIDRALHQSLAAVADAEGVSMNAVAEEALTREVSSRAATLARIYEQAAVAMRAHARPRLADVIDELAVDEATTPEPVPAHHAATTTEATFTAITTAARRVG